MYTQEKTRKLASPTTSSLEKKGLEEPYKIITNHTGDIHTNSDREREVGNHPDAPNLALSTNLLKRLRSLLKTTGKKSKIMTSRPKRRSKKCSTCRTLSKNMVFLTKRWFLPTSRNSPRKGTCKIYKTSDRIFNFWTYQDLTCQGKAISIEMCMVFQRVAEPNNSIRVRNLFMFIFILKDPTNLLATIFDRSR